MTFSVEPILSTQNDFAAFVLSDGQGSKAIIYPNKGASLQQLALNNKIVIDNILIDNAGQMALQNSSGSAIMFPFPNRIDKGTYSFENKSYQLEINEPKHKHAMHGLVYKQAFERGVCVVSDGFAQISFVYRPEKKEAGFPFLYSLEVVYTLYTGRLKMEIIARNEDQEIFPFAIGWHPYFVSSDLSKSTLEMPTSATLEIDDRMLPTQWNKQTLPTPCKIEAQVFDVCFKNEAQKARYQTPNYTLDISTSEPNQSPFWQIYTPPHRKSLAIEPMTAVANAFNNKIGLKTLAPEEHFKITWTLELKQN